MAEHSTLPVALHLAGRSVLLIGGGDEAVDKLPKLLRTGARVTVVAPHVAPELALASRRSACRWFARDFQPSDVHGVHLVILTEPDLARASQLTQLRTRHGFWLCAIDQPAVSDIFLVSTVTRGPVQIGISTGGQAPLLARRLRQALESALDARFSEFARKFAELRARLRTLPKSQRKQQLEGALNGFAIELHVRYPAADSAPEVPPKADQNL